ncbi:uncharacterized protein LOC111895563 [Lactuca sativa]|uniref:uncharacterized protein LOC111895563 n=1 Tax=Lactuca sativa TaxID=4236 RepID=UPI000CD8B577|nr:uncharacterized protein LOC111895563 [Lactuca sativa]
MDAMPPSLFGSPKPIEIMDWISEMEMGEALRMSWEALLEQLKMQYCSEVDLIDLNNEFQNLKKGNMSIDEYVTAFTAKMKLLPYLVPNKLFEIEKFADGLPIDFGLTVKMATTLKASVRVAKNVETQLREKGLERTEVGEKINFDGSSMSNKKSRFLKSSSKNFGGRKEAKWCENCKKKHYGKCGEDLTCYKCGRIGRYANECTSNKNVCYGCNEEGYIAKDCPKKNEVSKTNVFPRPKERVIQMTREVAREEVDVASGTFLVNDLPANILFDYGAN